MKMMIPSFNPASVASGTVRNPLPQNQQVNGSYGYLLWANESSVSLSISVNNNSFRIHPWELAKIDFGEPTQQVTWTQEVVLSNSASAPISLCLIDAYTPDEVISAAFPIPLVRNTNVGGVVTTSIVTQLINDGNAPGTVIIETTPTGQPSSALSVDNSGNVTIRALSSSVWTQILNIVAGSNVAAAVATLNLVAGSATMTSLQTTGTQAAFAGNYAIVASGPVTFEANAIRSNGSGRIIAGSFQPSVSSVAFAKLGYFSGTGSGTVATGAGTTATWIGITDNQAGSSATVGCVISGTNAVVTLGAAHTWMGIAL